MKCNVCKSNNVTEHDDQYTKPVKLKYSVCGDCKREFVSTAQILRNDRLIRESLMFSKPM